MYPFGRAAIESWVGEAITVSRLVCGSHPRISQALCEDTSQWYLTSEKPGEDNEPTIAWQHFNNYYVQYI